MINLFQQKNHILNMLISFLINQGIPYHYNPVYEAQICYLYDKQYLYNILISQDLIN